MCEGCGWVSDYIFFKCQHYCASATSCYTALPGEIFMWFVLVVLLFIVLMKVAMNIIYGR